MTAASERVSDPPAVAAPASARSSSSSPPLPPATITAWASSAIGCSRPVKKKWSFALHSPASSSSDSTQKLAKRVPNMPMQLDKPDSRSPGAQKRADLSPQAGRGEGCGGLSAPALYRLMTWMSPAYPVGAFSYSGGIEWAVEAGDIRDADTLRSWLATMIRDGSLFCDAAMFCHAHRASASGDDQALAAVAELAAAFVGSKERFLETTAQGEAFRQITQAAWPAPAMDRLTAAWDGPLAYPIVVAAACAGHGIALIP